MRVYTTRGTTKPSKLGGVPVELLAYVKSDDTDTTHLACLSIASDFVADGVYVSAYSWARPVSATGTAVQAGILSVSEDNGGDPINNFFLVWDENDRFVSGFTQDVSGTVRQQIAIAAGGDFDGEWHFAFGEYDQPNDDQFAGYDDEALVGGARTSTPNAVAPRYIHIFADAAGLGQGFRYLSGKILHPLYIVGVAGDVANYRADYFAGLGVVPAAMLANSALQSAPRPKAGTAGETCRIFPVDASGNEVTAGSPVVIGLPTPYAGVGEDMHGDVAPDADEAYLKVAYPTPEGTAGMTVGFEYTPDADPGTVTAVIGRQKGTAGGGVRLAPQTGANPNVDILAWDGSSSRVNSQLVTAIAYGTRVWVFFSVANDGLSAMARIIETDGTVVSTKTFAGPFAGPITWTEPLIFGRGRLTSGNNPFVDGQLHRLLVTPETLTEAELIAIADGTTTSFVAGTIDVSGYDSNMIDDADAIRGDGKVRLYGPLDFSRIDTAEGYADIPTIESAGTAIEVGA